MKKPVYALRDELAGFLSVNVDINDEVAKRNFLASMKNHGLNNAIIKDYSLYRIGDIETDSGQLDAFTVPQFLCRAYEGVEDVE